AMSRLGHPVDALNSALSPDEKREVKRRVRSGETKILYVAPEQLNNEASRELILSREIGLLAVDEAHCISEWGHSFRADYLKVAEFAKQSGAARVIALTATATMEVEADIAEAFAIQPEDCVRTDFYRPNLVLGCTPVTLAERDATLQRLMLDASGPSIVYVTQQKTAEQVADFLCRTTGLRALAYHAGQPTEHREAVQDEFIASEDNVIIVATIAFGMGIDKPNIRRVVHYNLPRSLEGYAQEIGRAGRDGKTSWCDTFFCADDIPLLESFARRETPSLKSVEGVLQHFFHGEEEMQLAPGSTRRVSNRTLAKNNDMKSNTLQMLMAFVDIYHRHIRATTPMYGTYKLQPNDGGRAKEVLGRFRVGWRAVSGRPQRTHEVLEMLSASSASEAVKSALSSHCSAGPKWATMDMEAAARENPGV
ncbi:unnamed protein product, partial [Polarella glacialis]